METTVTVGPESAKADLMVAIERVYIDDLAEPRLPEDVVAMNERARPHADSLSLNLDDLEVAARSASHLDDFGDDLYREPYGVCLGALQAEANLSPLGRISAHSTFVQYLCNRLLVVDYLRRHPEANEIEIERPIVICGLPRTGTTHLLNLISADTNLRSLPYWESNEPVPPLDEQGIAYDVDPRWLRCEQRLTALDHVLPHLRRMHDMYPDHVHEEIELLAVAGSTMSFDTMGVIPTWRRWYTRTDQTPYYLWLKKILQVLQHQRGPDRWVLKSPQHLEMFGPLVTAFPDATFVVTHRDAVSVTASLATMISYTARMSHAEVDPPAIAAYWSEIVEDFLRAAVGDHHLLPPAQTIDVRFDDFMADDVAMVERIYTVAGLSFTGETRAAMEQFMTRHPRGKWGSVEYRLDDLGLDLAERRDAFRFYRDRFQLRDEPW